MESTSRKAPSCFTCHWQHHSARRSMERSYPRKRTFSTHTSRTRPLAQKNTISRRKHHHALSVTGSTNIIEGLWKDQEADPESPTHESEMRTTRTPQSAKNKNVPAPHSCTLSIKPGRGPSWDQVLNSPNLATGMARQAQKRRQCHLRNFQSGFALPGLRQLVLL